MLAVSLQPYSAAWNVTFEPMTAGPVLFNIGVSREEIPGVNAGPVLFKIVVSREVCTGPVLFNIVVSSEDSTGPVLFSIAVKPETNKTT